MRQPNADTNGRSLRLCPTAASYSGPLGVSFEGVVRAGAGQDAGV